MTTTSNSKPENVKVIRSSQAGSSIRSPVRWRRMTCWRREHRQSIHKSIGMRVGDIHRASPDAVLVVRSRSCTFWVPRDPGTLAVMVSAALMGLNHHLPLFSSTRGSNSSMRERMAEPDSKK